MLSAKRLLLACSLLVPYHLTSFAAAEDAAALLSRLQAARADGLLTKEGLKPWHLKAGFDRFDKHGAVIEHGTYEEWWGDRYHTRISIVSPSYTAVETADSENLYRTSNSAELPPYIAVIRAQTESPLPSEDELSNITPVMQKKTLGGVALDCIMLAPNVKGSSPPFGLYATYCFDPGQTVLRISYNYGTQAVVRNRQGRFEGQSVALDLAVVQDGKPDLKISVDQLATFIPRTDEFAKAANQDSIAGGASLAVGPGVLAGRKLRGSAPAYPEDAKRGHISGHVILHVVIGKDGHVSRIVPIQSPDSSLTTAAVASVRQWLYKPYLLNGSPVEVDSTITVSFTISP